MKSRVWFGVAIVVALGTAAIAIFVQQLRSLYAQDLVRRVWPPAVAAPSILISAANTVSPVVFVLGDSRIGQWEFPRPDSGQIIKAGISGATTAEIRAQAAGYLQKYHPDVVVIEAGINDLKLLGVRPDLDEEVVQAVGANLKAIVEECVGVHARVLLLTVWPPGKPGLVRELVWSSDIATAVNEVNRRIMALQAPERGVFVCDLLKEAGPIVYSDTLHLRPEVYMRLTPALDRRLQALGFHLFSP